MACAVRGLDGLLPRPQCLPFNHACTPATHVYIHTTTQEAYPDTEGPHGFGAVEGRHHAGVPHYGHAAGDEDLLLWCLCILWVGVCVR